MVHTVLGADMLRMADDRVAYISHDMTGLVLPWLGQFTGKARWPFLQGALQD